MNGEPKPRLWLVDDEFNDIYLRVMRPRIESEGIQLEVRAGVGMLQQFMLEYPNQKNLQRDCFLLDVFMVVPPLLSNPKYWGDYPAAYEGTGFALANWLCAEQGVKLERIRAASAHRNYSMIRHAFGLGYLHCYDNWHSVHWRELSDWAKVKVNISARQKK